MPVLDDAYGSRARRRRAAQRRRAWLGDGEQTEADVGPGPPVDVSPATLEALQITANRLCSEHPYVSSLQLLSVAHEVIRTSTDFDDRKRKPMRIAKAHTTSASRFPRAEYFSTMVSITASVVLTEASVWSKSSM